MYRRWAAALFLSLLLAMGVPLKALGTMEPPTITVAVVESLEYPFQNELLPVFNDHNPDITVKYIFDTADNLVKRLNENPAQAHIVMMPTMEHMTELKNAGVLDNDSILQLLIDPVVLVTGIDSTTQIAGFDQIGAASRVALADPASDPLAPYAQSALNDLGLVDAIRDKVALCPSMDELYNWLESGAAEVGVVFRSDVAMTNKVRVIDTVPKEKVLFNVIYPVAQMKNSGKGDIAKFFVDFLQSKEAMEIFDDYGLSSNL